MDLIDRLQMLCALPAVSGFEHHAAAQVAELLRPFCGEVTTDCSGNVIGVRRCGKENAKTILLDAHLDQIGFLITEVLEGGFARFAPVGGVDPRMLLGNEVTILSKPPLYGVIACMPPHLLKHGEQDKAVPIEEMVIDTGLLDAKAVLKTGTPVIFAQPPVQLSKDSFTGKCLDDRAGIAAILLALERLATEKSCGVDIAVLISAQEEATGLGAQTGAFAVQPDYAIAVDVSHAKTPDAPPDGVFAFGGGTLIGVGPNLHRGLTQALMKTAKAHSIKHQLEVMEGSTGTNAWTLQIVGRGIATALLSIPLRYMHTPIETIRLCDLEATASLIHQFIRRFDGEVSA